MISIPCCHAFRRSFAAGLVLVLAGASAIADQAAPENSGGDATDTPPGPTSAEAAAPEDPDPKPEPDPAPERVSESVEGWPIELGASLAAELEDPESLGARALRRLEVKLSGLKELVPEERIRDLQKVTIVIEAESPSGLKGIQYHPSRDWLREHGHDPDLARKVHIPQAERFLSRQLSAHQPMVILHELAHAYHDQVLGFDDAGILAAFRRVRDSGALDEVVFVSGGKRRHYALTDHKEFFAEMTEAYVSVNDFYPFVRGELRESDPETYELMEAVWGPMP